MSDINKLDNTEEEIPDKSIFMICERLNKNALSELSIQYHTRYCREGELDIWKAMPFDDPKQAEEYREFMTEFYNSVYANKGDLFYQRCLFVCDVDDKPIATCFLWKAYDEFNTIHWLKVVKEYEGKGIGRALLSVIMKDLKKEDYPVYLHTQPGSYRAIKLYSDFGFKLISDPIIGSRKNDLEECLPILKKFMPKEDFERLKITEAPKGFLEKVGSDNQF